MRAHRVRVRVSGGHQLSVTLPSDFPPGDVDVIVLEAPLEATSAQRARLTVDELLASRLSLPPGVGPVTVADMERAIADGASGRGSV